MYESSVVSAHCTLPDGATFDVLASNIARTGLYFYVINSPVLLAVGDSIAFSFDASLLKGISTTATIQDRAEVLDMVRFGVVFQEMSNGGEAELAEHGNLSERRPFPETDEEKSLEKAVVFIVDDPQSRDHYSFLDQGFNAIHSGSFNLLGRLLAALPDVILFNSSLPDTKMVLQILTNHAVLKGTPIIEIRKKRRKAMEDLFSSLPFPTDEAVVLDTLRQAIMARTISRMLRDGDFSGPFKTGVSILLVDDSSAPEAHHIEALRDLNCDVKRITNLKLLYDSFVWSTPDVIAIDENTQEIDAATVCRLLNMNRDLKDVPKILLSKRKGQRHSNGSGLFSSVLTEPFTAKQLLSQIHYLLARSAP